MSKAALQSLVVLLLGAGSVSPGLSQPLPADATTALQKEIAQLNRSMEQLVVLLRENLEAQHTELLLKRTELSRLDLTPVENELRASRANLDAMQEERDRAQARLDEVEEHLADRGEKVPQSANQELLMMKRQAEGQVKFMKDRIRGVELRITELENDLASRRREIEALLGIVDERLRLRR